MLSTACVTGCQQLATWAELLQLTMRLPGAARSGLKLRSSAGPKELKAEIWPADTVLGTTTCSGESTQEG